MLSTNWCLLVWFHLVFMSMFLYKYVCFEGDQSVMTSEFRASDFPYVAAVPPARTKESFVS